MDGDVEARQLAELLLASKGSPVPKPPMRPRAHTRQVGRLLAAFQGKQHPVAVLHDHPDPDAIGAGLALATLLRARLGIEPAIVYGGVIARAENRAMVEELRIPLLAAADCDWGSVDAAALLDCQPAGGNHALPANLAPAAVLDHHPSIAELGPETMSDIRPDYGATCTMFTEYLEDAQVHVDERLATALFYGIKTDTQDLGRQASGIDALAYLRLFVAADKRALARIQNPRLPRAYYLALHNALERVRMYGDTVVAALGDLEMPETTGETADLIVRLEGARWALCVGRFADRLLFSVRTTDESADAGAVAMHLVNGRGHAGGHWRLAGGYYSVQGLTPASVDRIEAGLVRAFLDLVGAEQAETALLGTSPPPLPGPHP